MGWYFGECNQDVVDPTDSNAFYTVRLGGESYGESTHRNGVRRTALTLSNAIKNFKPHLYGRMILLNRMAKLN